jgi:Flp pilus assembly protein TadG
MKKVDKMTKANDSGQTLVETAISLSIFLLLVLGTVDFGYLFSTKVTLQNAVRQAGRYAITGQCITGSDGSCSKSRYNSIVQILENTSLGLLNSSEINLTCTNNGGGCPNNAGGPGDIVTITVTYPYHFMTGPIGAFFPSHSYTLKVSAAFTNEIFPPSES